ncbi:MAG TPA: branched-chain amino acid ABC transporter permease [Acidimicrobiales bacterium]|nr:branched-chain amino acid ABC transporter permease [Acidimicrobiales bacterium]
MNFYLSLTAVYFVVYAMGALALNLQFGLGGIVNFGFIIFESAGAYAAALTSVGSSATGVAQSETYFWGTSLPFPLPLIVAVLVGGLLAAVIGPATMRKMRRDYQAAAMLAIAIIANQLVGNTSSFLNGGNGIANIPAPLRSVFGSSVAAYDWAYVAWSFLLGGGVFLLCRWISISPFGRAVRLLRDDEEAAASLGINAWSVRMRLFVVGGMIAGLTGGLLVEFIGAWSPSAWNYQETFVLLQAVILGGVGSEYGAVFGALIVGVILLQLPSFLPAIGYPGLIDSLQWILIGVVYLAVLWFLPQGTFRERASLRLGGRAPPEKVGPLGQESIRITGPSGATTNEGPAQ